MKETGTVHWTSPNTGATNSSGFNALPAGFRYSGSGSDIDINNYTYYWSTEHNPVYPSERYSRELGYAKTRLDKFSLYRGTGVSIRCVKD